MIKLPVVILISGGGTNLQALIDASLDDLPIEICAVISNKPGVYGLERAKKAHIQTLVVDHKDFDDRESFDRALIDQIDEYKPGLVLLAGFMRILTSDFVKHYEGRLLNIHPSLLPKFQGLNTHQRALDSGEEYHGASIHYVTEELDGGPVILQARIPVKGDNDAASLAARVLEKEHIIYPLAVRWIAEGRVTLKNKHIWFDDVILNQPKQLDELVNES